MSQHFDVVVLGAGPGGYVAAIRSAQLGLSTAIIEEKYWGGVCLNVGCIPSKALLRNAELVQLFQNEASTFGISVDGKITIDYSAAYKRSRTVADGRVKGVHYLMKKNDITQFEGWGTFTDEHTLSVATAEGTETVTFDNCIVATGATTKLVPGTGLSERVVTYEEQILQDQLPQSMVIAGAGAVGVEFAYILHNYGVSVTIVEFVDRLVPQEDAEVSKELGKRFRRMGIELLTSTRVEDIDDSGEQVTVTVTKDGEQRTLQTDKVLQALGFQPKVDGYGLDATAVRLTEGNAIDIDTWCRTSVGHIYAIGDVTGKLMLAHTAEAMGIVAAETIGGAETQEIDYDLIPRATYCQPQIASFGYGEAEAAERGYDIEVAKFPFMANGKAHGLGDTTGFVKLISDKTHGELIGGHLIGPEVTELLPELTLAAQWDLTVHEVARNIHAHPSLSESVKEAIHGLAGHMINM